MIHASALGVGGYMASTVSNVSIHKVSDQFKTDGTFNLGTYATAGITITAGKVGLTQIEDFTVNKSEGYTFSPAVATGGAYVTVVAYDADYAATATGALIQVATGTDLSSVSLTFVAHGK